jgi:hypothetical protein
MTPSTFLDATALAMADIQQRWPGMIIEPDGVMVYALDRRALDRLEITVDVSADTFGEMFKGVEVEMAVYDRGITYSAVYQIGDHTVKYKAHLWREEEPNTPTTIIL